MHTTRSVHFSIGKIQFVRGSISFMKTAPHPPLPPLPRGHRHHHHGHIQSSGIIMFFMWRKLGRWRRWSQYYQNGDDYDGDGIKTENDCDDDVKTIPMLICVNLDWDKSMWLWNQFLNLKLARWCLLSPSPQTLFVPRHLVSNIRERNKLMFLFSVFNSHSICHKFESVWICVF